uniref:Uncharacterized protein n=1 Tax=Cacopsylla melanoneura TaxID=428564 RepID=A0A8D8LW28_9HEMI
MRTLSSPTKKPRKWSDSSLPSLPALRKPPPSHPAITVRITFTLALLHMEEIRLNVNIILPPIYPRQVFPSTILILYFLTTKRVLQLSTHNILPPPGLSMPPTLPLMNMNMSISNHLLIVKIHLTTILLLLRPPEVNPTLHKTLPKIRPTLHRLLNIVRRNLQQPPGKVPHELALLELHQPLQNPQFVFHQRHQITAVSTPFKITISQVTRLLIQVLLLTTI